MTKHIKHIGTAIDVGIASYITSTIYDVDAIFEGNMFEDMTKIKMNILRLKIDQLSIENIHKIIIRYMKPFYKDKIFIIPFRPREKEWDIDVCIDLPYTVERILNIMIGYRVDMFDTIYNTVIQDCTEQYGVGFM